MRPAKLCGQFCAAVLSFSAAAAPVAAQPTAEDLINDAASTENVLTYGMGYALQRYSPLTQIDKTTVAKLRPVWTYSLADLKGQESQPLVAGTTMYVTTHNSAAAIDARSGRQIWKQVFEYPPYTPAIVCCGIVNRGSALYEGKLIRTTLDNHVVAYDAATGAELWKSEPAADVNESYSMTVAPLVANGVVITGISGGDYGIRGFIDGWDPADGKHLWRRYTIPAPGEPGGDTWPGDTWQKGGGPAWLTGSYDPELDLVYWGVGNGGPWNAEFRKGDNLYISSVLALRPKSGEIVWHYQFSPNDTYDYDGVNENILAELTIDGVERKVILHADRNGFFYVIDRENGKLLAANAFVDKINWADGIDMETGRPILSQVSKKFRAGELQDIWPSALGGKNWSPMSYNPKTGLVYANTLEMGVSLQLQAPQFKKGTLYMGFDPSKIKWLVPEGTPHAYVRAIDPLTGESKWKNGLEELANMAGMLSTAGGVLFTGKQTGEFEALDADTGETLWSFQTGSGIVGMPITWEMEGKQYVSVLSGSGAVYRKFIPIFGSHLTAINETLQSVPPGGMVWTFVLD